MRGEGFEGGLQTSRAGVGWSHTKGGERFVWQVKWLNDGGGIVELEGGTARGAGGASSCSPAFRCTG